MATRALLLFLTVMLAGCAGYGIPATDNPDTKLSQADYLMNGAGRIMQARRMTEQAMMIFEERKDEAGLARAYREYGLVALAGGMGDDPVILRDPKVPFQPRPGDLRDAEIHLKHARDLSAETRQPDLVANIDFVLGNMEVMRGNPPAACPYYDRAIQDFGDAKAQRPDAKFELPPGIKDPVEFVVRAKREAGCSSAQTE